MSKPKMDDKTIRLLCKNLRPFATYPCPAMSHGDAICLDTLLNYLESPEFTLDTFMLDTQNNKE